jgi:hypothetical protein
MIEVSVGFSKLLFSLALCKVTLLVFDGFIVAKDSIKIFDAAYGIDAFDVLDVSLVSLDIPSKLCVPTDCFHKSNIITNRINVIKIDKIFA